MAIVLDFFLLPPSQAFWTRCTDSRSGVLIIRNNRQDAREGSRQRRRLHGTPTKPSMGSSHKVRLLPI